MTATPIPRTLAMAMYAYLDTSVIDELPPNRQQISTKAYSNAKRDATIERLKQQIADGVQAYWVCTLIEESEFVDSTDATNLFEELKAKLPGVAIGLVHSRLSYDEKEAQMKAFAENRLQLLVSTTVIEVGVNVPNASIMIIENAERLGLAQLHQLRGRVGRGDKKSFCILMYQNPLSKVAKMRLEIMGQTQDGFLIAQKDLEIRGEGEILGSRQSGDINFKVTNLEQDFALIEEIPNLLPLLTDHHKNILTNRYYPNIQTILNS
jgi:ATP-dependent DNA helicase RecG